MAVHDRYRRNDRRDAGMSLARLLAEPAFRAEEEPMANRNQQTPGRNTENPRPQQDDLGQTGQERERGRDDRSRMEEDDEVE
jgi:hypothetical protein